MRLALPVSWRQGAIGMGMSPMVLRAIRVVGLFTSCWRHCCCCSLYPLRRVCNRPFESSVFVFRASAHSRINQVSVDVGRCLMWHIKLLRSGWPHKFSEGHLGGSETVLFVSLTLLPPVRWRCHHPSLTLSALVNILDEGKRLVHKGEASLLLECPRCLVWYVGPLSFYLKASKR